MTFAEVGGRLVSQGAVLVVTGLDHAGEVGTWTGRKSISGSMIELQFEDGARAWKLRSNLQPKEKR